MLKILTVTAAATATLMLAVPALAEDMQASGGNSVMSWGLGTGVTFLHGEEIVYAYSGDPTVLSHLFWDSTAPVLSANLDVTLPEGWTFKGSAVMSMGGDSYMEDYDWIDPSSYAFDDWSHRSQHPDTNLDWYFNGQLFVGKDVIDHDGMKVNINGGVKYINVQWTAYGGSYVYSSGPGSPRDLTGDFPDGEKGITFQQIFPAAMAGIDASFTHDAWDFAVSAHGGMTFSPGVYDHHWMRTDLGPGGGLFTYVIDSAPIAEISGTATYAFSDTLSFFLTGSYDTVFTTRGDQQVDSLAPDGSVLGPYAYAPDAVATNFGAFTVTAGLKGNF
jgi:plasminogen activator